MLVPPDLNSEFLSPWLAADSSPERAYAQGSLEIRRKFEADGDGVAAARARSLLVDYVLRLLYQIYFRAELRGPERFCLSALGGYGRSELYPQSDVDLLFVSGDRRVEENFREVTARMVKALWDMGIRLGCTTRTLAECGQLQRENIEFSIALLDARRISGDTETFNRLRDQIIPHLVARDARELLQRLLEMTRQRHARYGDTIFHLEPNIKEVPGGLRDFHVARWVAIILRLEERQSWRASEDIWPPLLWSDSRRAFDFLFSLRCFLHYASGRDHNNLTYEMQDRAARTGVGQEPGHPIPAADWMRIYFRHARTIDRLLNVAAYEAAPARSSLFTVVENWRSRVSNSDFTVVKGRIYPRQPEAISTDPSLLLRLFEFSARHGLDLSREAERWVEDSLPRMAADLPFLPGLWNLFRQILLLPHAAEALRVMHRLGVLCALFPEFRAIDCLVIRDFYHRYTVDEHTFVAIQCLVSLLASESRARPLPEEGSSEAWERKFAEIMTEIERRELLFLSLLFHDVGKGMPTSQHIEGSLRAVEAVLPRLGFGEEEAGTVQFLIENHLVASETLQRRDVFDPETVGEFSRQVVSSERLKMLCLMTYADVKAVNPEALTPWKAEMLWQLYVATAGYLDRSLDEERLHTEPEGLRDHDRMLLSLIPAVDAEGLRQFLDGFPHRYLAMHSRQEIIRHFELYCSSQHQPMRVDVRRRNHLYELTVITADRPFLFSSITGTLAAWGMDIVKAAAFANSSGTILDTFLFRDRFRTFELNPGETDRFKTYLTDVLSACVDPVELMRGREESFAGSKTKIRVETQIRFDELSSSHSTLLELLTRDRPALLFQVSSILANLRCNIEAALVDTQGQKAIDVFYLTYQGMKLDVTKREEARRALLDQL